MSKRVLNYKTKLMHYDLVNNSTSKSNSNYKFSFQTLFSPTWSRRKYTWRRVATHSLGLQENNKNICFSNLVVNASYTSKIISFPSATSPAKFLPPPGRCCSQVSFVYLGAESIIQSVYPNYGSLPGTNLKFQRYSIFPPNGPYGLHRKWVSHFFVFGQPLSRFLFPCSARHTP